MAPPRAERSAATPWSEARARAALAPYGRWEVDAIGAVWVPSLPPGETFVPYVTHGSWEPSNIGPRWESEVPWGPLTFSYGRWVPFGAGWGWRYGAAFDPASIVWRRGGGYVGWSAFDFWCFVLAEALYGPGLSSRAVRGPAAAPLVAGTVVGPAPDRTAPGLVVDLRGRRHDGGGRTTRAPDPPREEDSARSDASPAGRDASRWSTVVIRDEAAIARWQQLAELEVIPGTSIHEDDLLWDPGPRARTAPVVAGRAGSSPTGPVTGTVARPAGIPTVSAGMVPFWSGRAPAIVRPASEPTTVLVPAVARAPIIQQASPVASAPSGVGGIASGVWTGAGTSRGSLGPTVTPATPVAPLGGAAWGGNVDVRAFQR